MLELQTKIKRQIEIVGLALDRNTIVRIGDLAEMYGCDDLTIKRDLQSLRSFGIDIHSGKKDGVTIIAPVSDKTMKQLVSQYLGICNASAAIDRATSLLVTKRKERSLHYVVTLRKSIENGTNAVISYEKESHDIEEGREISPLMIFSGDGYWRVLAVHDGKVKQYILNKILSIQPTSRKFKKIPQEEIDELFRHSFKSWIGTEKFSIKLRMSPVWASRIKPRQLMEFEVITEEPDGSVILETTVNSLGEVASWVVSRGEGITVLEPEALRGRVVELAQGALKNYSSSEQLIRHTPSAN